MKRMDFTDRTLEPGVRKLFSPTLSCSFQVENGEGYRGILPSLGGDVIIDEDSIIRFIHRSMDPSDRPSVETLLRVL